MWGAVLISLWAMRPDMIWSAGWGAPGCGRLGWEPSAGSSLSRLLYFETWKNHKEGYSRSHPAVLPFLGIQNTCFTFIHKTEALPPTSFLKKLWEGALGRTVFWDPDFLRFSPFRPLSSRWRRRWVWAEWRRPGRWLPTSLQSCGPWDSGEVACSSPRLLHLHLPWPLATLGPLWVLLIM